MPKQNKKGKIDISQQIDLTHSGGTMLHSTHAKIQHFIFQPNHKGELELLDKISALCGLQLKLLCRSF